MLSPRLATYSTLPDGTGTGTGTEAPGLGAAGCEARISAGVAAD
jgi:hypothetical protein